jgi:signal transduction histidine kinase
LGSEKLVGTRLPAAAGIAGWAMQERQSARVTDAQSDPRFYNRVDRLSDMTTRSLLAVPLVLKGTVLGVVEAVNKNSGTFDEHDLEVLEALSSSTAIAIENARLYATEQQRAAALARALEQQRELDRLQREFIQNVSHELRTPLALIRGHAELLETGELGDLQSAQQKSASVISRRTRMLSKLVDDIIAVLMIEAQELKREPLSLAQLVRTSMADFQTAAETAGLTLSAEIAPDLPLVSGDSVALHRMLDNLVSNALKFTSAKGHVTMRLFRGEDTVTLQVSDTGVGIPNDRLERVFDRFYQVDGSTTRHYGGVGLGLALVKGIVEAHGGQITVASQVGQGTTFTVLLPACET